MSPVRFRWGMLFILIGLLLLFTNIGLLRSRFWADFVYFIPFLLIAIGVEKIFAGTRLKVISYLTSVFLLVAGLWIAFEGSRDGAVANFMESRTIHQELETGVEELQALIGADGTELTIRDATSDLMSGRFDEWSYKPDLIYIREGSVAHVELSKDSESHRIWGGMIRVETDEMDAWNLKFCRSVPLYLECNGDESDLHLNLSTTPLRDLKLRANDADIYLKVGNLEPLVQVEIVGFDAKVRLRVPRDAGIRISGIEDPDYLQTIGLRDEGDFYATEGYDTLTPQIDFQLEDSFRSLSVDYY